MNEKARNLTSAAVLTIVGAYWFLTADTFGPLSRLFPRVISGVVFVLALCLAVLTFMGRGPTIDRATGDAGERHVRSGTLIAALVLWTALVPLVGLLVASLIGVTLMGFITFRAHTGTVRAIIIALISVGAFYLLFQEILRVRFPMGLLG